MAALSPYSANNNSNVCVSGGKSLKKDRKKRSMYFRIVTFHKAKGKAGIISFIQKKG